MIAAAAPLMVSVAPWSVWPASWPWPVQVAFFLLLTDVLDYARHRLGHTVPALWRLHELHHAIDRLHVFRKHRFHFGEGIVRACLVDLPLLLLGAPAPLFAWGLAAINFFGYPAHAAVDFRLPRGLHRWWMTPAVHRLHHDHRRAIYNANDGALLSVWDVLLGTFVDPPHEANLMVLLGDVGQRQKLRERPGHPGGVLVGERAQPRDQQLLAGRVVALASPLARLADGLDQLPP